MSEREAMFWAADGEGAVRCELCPHGCRIPEGAAGLCGVRENRDGRLLAASWGQISSIALDPIEKKPLYMFHPGSRILSVGSYGCNLRCPFCQNCDISLEYDNAERNAAMLSPEQLTDVAKQAVPGGNIGVAYTYNEPLIGYEFVYDCARLVREAGMRNVLVSNGYINPEPLERLLPYIDAMNIDLKGFTDGFYHNLGGGPQAVKETIALARTRCHVEVTTLIIPGGNDSEAEIARLAAWLASLDPAIPLHLSRFFPRYKYADRRATPRAAVNRLREVAMGYLKNVFVGNM